MEQKPANSQKKKPAKTREERLRAALRANLKRRKSQARARQDAGSKES